MTRQSSGWAVAQTYGACERKAVANLHRMGFGDAFCPLYVAPARSRLDREVERPQFPCYIFVLIDLERHYVGVDRVARSWHSINSAIGVIRLLTDAPVNYTVTGGARHHRTRGAIVERRDPVPLFVPEHVVEGFVEPMRASPLPSGTVVRVRRLDSAFYGTVGTVYSMDKYMRVNVLMGILGREMELKFELADLGEVA